MTGCASVSTSAVTKTSCTQVLADEDGDSSDETSSGTITDETGTLDSTQKDLLKTFEDTWYDSLSTLQSGDIRSLLTDTTSASLNQSLLDYLCAERSNQSIDLKLNEYHYELTLTETEQIDDQTLIVTGYEDFVVNFAAYPDVDSEGWDAERIFTLRNDGSGWTLASMDSEDSQYSITMGELPDGQDAEAYYALRAAALLETAKSNIASRTGGSSSEETGVDVAYNRDAAVAYADEWADGRNGEWGDYTDYDGNCQNFGSQVLAAGGIPLDTVGAEIWKWYNDDPDQGAYDYGRSAAWTGVSDFVDYASSNTGYGLSAVVGAPYYSGEKGDLLLMKSDDNWQHTTVIAQVMTDSEGNTTDYLLDSNTANLRNYPASAYHYSDQTLVHILGWNNQ